MTKIPADIIFNTTVLTIEYLIDLLGINVTRLTLRRELFKSPVYPIVPLDFLCNMLDSWGVKSLVIKADIDLVRQINLPALAYLPGEQGAVGVFTIITGITDTQIYYFLAGSGLHKELIPDFEKKWAGGVLVPLEISETNKGESFYNDAKDLENILKLEYKNSIEIIDDFMTEDDCQFIIDYCNSKNIFGRSKVDLVSGERDIVHPVRTSYSAVIDDRSNEVVKKVYEKVATITKISTDQIEKIQCVRYGPDEQFGLHFDSDNSNKRIYTLLVYLNDDYKEGETHFPELNLKIAPKRGRCVMFTNVDETYDKILYSVHAGLPIKSGVKYACNIWVRYS